GPQQSKSFKHLRLRRARILPISTFFFTGSETVANQITGSARFNAMNRFLTNRILQKPSYQSKGV
ncbi:MAG: hypothetical protein ACE5HS_18835, partial [bacterium]